MGFALAEIDVVSRSKKGERTRENYRKRKRKEEEENNENPVSKMKKNEHS